MSKILQTECINPNSKDIDTKSTIEICNIMNSEDKKVPFAVEKAIPAIAPLIDDVVKAFKRGGRLIYIGAGTSGRLGVLDASECPPTFGVPSSMVIGIIAGGDSALRNAVEKAEDNREQGIKDLEKIGFSVKDILVGLTASGSAPYVAAALEYAQGLGAVTGAICCNRDSLVFNWCIHKICIEVGPEIISGSTRLKSGTAEKLVLNMITTVSMIRMGMVYDNYMVNLIPTNIKLEKRAKRLIKIIAVCSDEDVDRVWESSGKNTSVSILMILYSIDASVAHATLSKFGNNLHLAMNELENDR